MQLPSGRTTANCMVFGMSATNCSKSKFCLFGLRMLRAAIPQNTTSELPGSLLSTNLRSFWVATGGVAGGACAQREAIAEVGLLGGLHAVGAGDETSAAAPLPAQSPGASKLTCKAAHAPCSLE